MVDPIVPLEASVVLLLVSKHIGGNLFCGLVSNRLKAQSCTGKQTKHIALGVPLQQHPTHNIVNRVRKQSCLCFVKFSSMC